MMLVTLVLVQNTTNKATNKSLQISLSCFSQKAMKFATQIGIVVFLNLIVMLCKSFKVNPKTSLKSAINGSSRTYLMKRAIRL